MDPSKYLKDLVGLLCRQYSHQSHWTDRADFLKIIADLFLGHDGIWVCLWLLDEGEAHRELRLDQIVSPGGERHTSTSGHGGIFARIAEGGDVVAIARKVVSIRSGGHPLEKLAPEIGISAEDEHFFPLCEGTGQIGCVQVLTKGGGGVADSTALDLALESLTGQIQRSRQYRIWHCLNGLGKDLSGVETVQDALNMAARKVREGCWADSCVITYTRCDTRKSAIRGIDARAGRVHTEPQFIRRTEETQKATRLSAIRDGGASVAESGAAGMAWMGVPVTVPSWAGGGAGTGVVCVIEVVGKNGDGAFYAAFSRQDQLFVQGVAEMLAATLPKLELREALKKIADAVGKIPAGAGIEMELGAVFTALKNLVDDIAPCSTFLAVTRRSEVVYCSEQDQADAIRIAIAPLEAMEDEGIVRLVDRSRAYVTPLIDVEGERSRLVIGITTADILTYRKDIIGYLCREFGSLIGDRLRYQKMIRDLTEARHALRAGLMGAIGHLETAQRIFRRYRLKSAERLHEVLVADPEFRLSLEWAALFARRTAVFLDETRILLDNLGPDTLKITYFDFGGLLREVAVCLEPEAANRGCAIQIRNRMADELVNGWADRDLLYILLFNILENAVKYSYRDQQVTVTVSAIQDEWRVQVSNVGRHIPEYSRRRIFEPFQRDQGRVQPDSRRPGTGLGLPVASMILAAHDPRYEITLDSNPLGDVGEDGERALTTFSIPIPRRRKG